MSEYIGMIEHDESVLYITKDNSKLKAGTGCNTGVIPQYEVDYDDDFSLDENLQVLIETIESE